MDISEIMQGVMAGPSSEDKARAMNMGLLHTGLGLLARRNIGESGLLGIQASQGALDSARKDRAQQLQSAALIPQLQQSILSAKKAQTAADFYSPENRQQFMEGAIPEPPAELGGGPGRAGTMNFDRFLSEGAARGVIDPEKFTQHRALEQQRKDALAQQMLLSRERLEQAAQLQREKLEQQRIDEIRRSEDRRLAIDAANERARESVTQRQVEADRRSEDRRLALDAARARAEAKQGQLPTTALKLQQEELDAIGSASSIKSDLSAVKKQLEDKKLDLGPVSNLFAQGRNFAGFSNEKSKNFATFQATLERLRNESLRLNKGVQTEGDSQRAWNELIRNINDPGVVKQRIEEIERLNERAISLRKMNIDVIRSNYGLGSLDTSGQEAVTPSIGAADQTVKPTVPKIGDVIKGYRFKGGDPSSRNSWERAM